MRRRLVPVLLLVGACRAEATPTQPPTVAIAKPAQAPEAEARAAGLEPADHTYGVYLNDAKVGWMRSTLQPQADEVAIGIELHARVAGMGQVSRIRVEDSRVFDATSGQLVRLHFVQEAATGAVRIDGQRRGEALVLTIEAGNAKPTQTITTDETLEDALSAMRLAQRGEVGASAKATHFDASLQRIVTVEHRVAAIEQLMLAGVATPAVRIESRYEELGVSETSWYDRAGKVLETRVGGFFVARLEPPEVARKLDYQQDLLVSAAVKTPKPIRRSAELARLELTFAGFGDLVPPSSSRQSVRAANGVVELLLTRDPPLPQEALDVSKLPEEVKAQLAPTPFIQSDSAELRQAAERAVGQATSFAERIERLTRFVFEHVRDEYVPAYSNALEALASGRGDCTEHSVLFVALARALGIPARVVVGIAYWPPGDGFGWHAWAEVYGPDGRWYAVDPTWNQPVADATHIKLAEGGPAEQARIVMLLGRLKVTHMRP